MTHAQLIKTAGVYDRDTTYSDAERQWFIQRNEDTGAVEKIHVVPTELWDEMGRPDLLTVTVEPWDRLNDGEQS